MHLKTSHLAIGFLFLAVLLVPGCSRMYKFSGTVVDGDGQPIAGVQIVLYPHDWKRPTNDALANCGKSDENGKFKTSWGNAVGVEFFRMLALKDGFDEDSRIVADDEKDVRIVLSRNATK